MKGPISRATTVCFLSSRNAVGLRSSRKPLRVLDGVPHVPGEQVTLERNRNDRRASEMAFEQRWVELFRISCFCGGQKGASPDSRLRTLGLGEALSEIDFC
jgi:hypothetical protein